jgi:hypothetical protein
MKNATVGSGQISAIPTSCRPGAGSRVLREIIRTPAFLEIIKLHASGLDPESARELVRAFLWEDVELSLSLVGTVPEMVNYLAAAALELGRQMNNFPGGLLDQYVTQIGSEIDVEVLNEFPGVFGPLLENIRFKETAAMGLGKAVNAGAGFVNRAAASNPHFVRDLCSEVDGREVLRASFAVGRSVMKWLASGVSGLLGRQ